MKFLVRFCGKRTLSILFVTSLISLFLDLMGIALIFPFLKIFISPEIIQTNKQLQSIYTYLHFRGQNEFIATAGISLVIIYIFRFALKIILTRVKYNESNNVTCRLSSTLFNGMLEARYSLFTEESTSEMVSIINAYTIHSMICLEAWIIILNEIFVLFFMFVIFTLLNPVVTLAFIAVFALIGVTLYLGLVKKMAQYGQNHSRLNLLVYKIAFAVSNSIKDIKIMGLETSFGNTFSRLWKEFSHNESKSKTVKSIPKEFSETLIFSGIIIVCLALLWTHQNMMDMIPMLGVIAVSSMRILPSFNRIVSSYNDYKFYRKSLTIVSELHAKFNLYKHEIQHVDMDFNDVLSIRNLGFRYQDKTLFDAISLTIPKGGSVAFVGPSGAGKSTLLDVIAGLRESEKGEFRLDGVLFDPFKTDALRTRVGYVPQQVNLIDDTIAFNISFDKNYDKSKMDKVIKMARLSSYIEELDLGMESVVGESGVRVSGGQRQRIGIARALYHDPEILIFDEATSSLDNVTERELMSEINSLSGSKTLIIVAHRLSTVENCDIIYLLDQGRVVAQGTHKELIASSPVYQNMYNQQHA